MALAATPSFAGGLQPDIEREELEYTELPFGSTITLTIHNNIKFVKRRLTVTGNVTTFNLSGVKSGDRGTIYVYMDGSGHILPKPNGHIGQFEVNNGLDEVTELLFEHNGLNVVWRSIPLTI